MTENEAIEYMENEVRCIKQASHCDRDCLKCGLVKEEQPLLESFAVAIQALEEIQQYRAIGTVEGYKRAVETSKENYLLYAEHKAKLQEYQSIGTVEEIKSMKENGAFSGIELAQIAAMQMKLRKYQEIDTVENCSMAMDIVKTMIERGTEPVEMNVLQSYIRFENDLVDNGYTFRSIMEARKKMKPKPIRSDSCTCPSCGTHNEVIQKRRNTVAFDTVYCWHCGQAMEIKRD